MKFVLLLCCSCLVILAAKAGVIDTTNEPYYLLREYLLDGGYHSDMMPKPKKGPLNVSICFALERLKDMDDKNGIIELGGFFIMRWRDKFLSWDGQKFCPQPTTPPNLDINGTTNSTFGTVDFFNDTLFNDTDGQPEKCREPDEFYIRLDEIWKPDIALYNSVDQRKSPLDAFGRKGVFATLLKNGDVYATMPADFVASCGLELQSYPFDFQNCTLAFGSWSHPEEVLDFELCNNGKGVLDQLYESNSEWELTKVEMKTRSQVFYSKHAFKTLFLSVGVQRRGLLVMYSSLLAPVMCLILGFMVFYLPPESGERISLCVTLLLTMVVFLQLFSDNMPNSSSLPVLAQGFGASIILLTVETSLSIIIINVHYNGEHGSKVPRWLKVVVLIWLATICCSRGMVKNKMKEMNVSEMLIEGSKKRAAKARKQTKQFLKTLTSFGRGDHSDFEDGEEKKSLVEGQPTIRVEGMLEPVEINMNASDRSLSTAMSDSSSPLTSASSSTDVKQKKSKKVKVKNGPTDDSSQVVFPRPRGLDEKGGPAVLDRIEAQVSEIYDLIQSQLRQNEGDDSTKEEWRLIAYVLDRISFIFYILVAVGFFLFWWLAEKLNLHIFF